MAIGIFSQWWVRTRYPRWFTKYKCVSAAPPTRVCGICAGTEVDAFVLNGVGYVFFLLCSYIVAAALDGGTQVISFILNFAVFGASGNPHNFPQWWGNGTCSNFPPPSRRLLFSVDGFVFASVH